MTKEKRTIYIKGIELGYKSGVDLLNMVEDYMNYYENRKNKPEANLSYLHKQISKYIAQWENIKIGDNVEYISNRTVKLSLNEQEPKQLEFNFNDRVLNG